MEPPHSLNVKTNVARTFPRIVDKKFTKTHRFSKLFNRNNLKVSYICLPNISSIISSHNKKVLTDITPSTDPTCNCREKDTCPLNGKCYDKSVLMLREIIRTGCRNELDRTNRKHIQGTLVPTQKFVQI